LRWRQPPCCSRRVSQSDRARAPLWRPQTNVNRKLADLASADGVTSCLHWRGAPCRSGSGPSAVDPRPHP
jgi:hypothetical protein